MNRKSKVQLLTRKLKVIASVGNNGDFLIKPGELVILSFYTDPISSERIKHGLQNAPYYLVSDVKVSRLTHEVEGVLFFDSEIELHCYNSEYRLIIL